LIVADDRHSFELHVPALELPFVVLLKQQRTHKGHDRRVVREYPNNFSASLNFSVYAFERIG
jgi:hypothetical protein